MALEEPGRGASEAATGASASASAATASVAALPFKPESAEVGFPWAGALLLLALIVVAVAARWRGASSLPAWLGGWAGAARTVPSPADVQVESTARLNPQVQLHVVRWSGRRILVATAANMPPVVLDRQDGMPAGKEQA